MKTRIRKIMNIVSLLICIIAGFTIGIFGTKVGIPIWVLALVSFIMGAIISIVNAALSGYLENKYSK